MREKTIGAIPVIGLILLVVLATAYQTAAQAAAARYPNMVPIAEYLMADRGAEIALARSAAPESVSRDAEVLVLGRHGFQTAVKGKNGFVCLVARSWSSAPDADFWNPKVRVPMCLNAAAARSYLVHINKWTDLALAGHTKAQITQTVAAAVNKKELPAMESGAMCYMMGKQGYAGDSGPAHWPPHLMFFYSETDLAIWGANRPGSPVLGENDPMENVTSFVILVHRWSDGTEDR